MAVRVKNEGVVFEGDTVAELLELITAFGKSDTDDGWIEWNGGEMPVSGDTLVQTIHAYETKDDYDTLVLKAGEYNWEPIDKSNRITHYRIMSEDDV